jgi:hypothetical protein
MPYTYPSPLTVLERTPQGHQELDRLHLWPRTGALISGLTAMGFLRHWGDVVFVTLSHPKQSPTEHCEAELKLTAGVVVFSVGVNEGSPQASRPTGPAEHACIVFHIHIVSICGRGEHRYVAPCPLRKSDESPRSPSRVVVVVSSRWTSSPFRLGQRPWPLWPSAALIPHLASRRQIHSTRRWASPSVLCLAQHLGGWRRHTPTWRPSW